MPKLNKRTKQSQNAIKKRWKQAENPEVTLELSDAEPDIIDESWFNTFWIKGEETRFDNDEITNGMKELQSNTLEQLIENAKKAHVWNKSSRGPVYNGDAQSTLRNKRAYWRKAALGSKKITEMFPTNEAAEPDTNPTFFTFENAYDSSDDDNEFTLESLDSLLKKKKDDLQLQTVSQFLHLVRDYGFTKIDASNLLAQSLNKGPWEENQLHRKSQGLSIHVSDFLCESIGRLRLSEEDCSTNDLLPDGERLVYTDACVTMYPGTNRDGWWKNEDVVKQVKERAIPIFERTHLRKVALFMFDNNCNHNAFADDALVVSRMNMKDGGKQPLLRDSKMPDGSPHIMTFTDVDGVVKSKGIRRVLEERGLWMPGLKRKCNACTQHNLDPNKLDCCATRILSAQPDFASQRIHLQEVSCN